MKWDESKHPRDEIGRFTEAPGSRKMSQKEKYNILWRRYETGYTINPLPLTIKLPDEPLPRSVGAKWRNEKILLPDGTSASFLENSVLQNKEVIAGKGVRRKIDIISTLIREYPETEESEWTKVKAIAEIVYSTGIIEKAEVHWYEYPGVGKVKFKVKL